MVSKIAIILGALLAQSPPPILPTPMTGPNFTNETRQSRQRANAEMLLLAAADPSVPLIPLSPASPRFGYALNDFLFTRAQVIQAADEGKPMTANEVMVLSRRLIHSGIVAFPLRCGSADVKPVAIGLVTKFGPRAGPSPTDGDLWKGKAEIRRHLGGLDVPDGAIARAFVGTLEISTARVTYDAPACPSQEPTLSFNFELKTAEADPDGSAIVPLPRGVDVPWPARARVSVFIDANGHPKLPLFIDGPSALERAAVAQAMSFRFTPYRVNSTPVIESVVLPLTFVGEGVPTARRMTAADLNPPPLGFTPDVPRLSLSNTRCPASTSGTYGMNDAEPIPTGGGAAALVRERAYLENLRGPQGEGLFFSHPGTIKSATGSEVHWYNVTYDRLGTFMTLFFDTSSRSPAPMLAPPGFSCAAPFAIVR